VQNVGTVVTDHRMVFSVSPVQTTLYDQIEYTGSPADFAWVLPIKGTVTVGVSSDALFAAMDQQTQTTILAPPLPPCPVCTNTKAFGSALPPGAAELSGGDDGGGSVTVLSQSVVGPYEQVQLQSTDPAALTNWLASHGYTIPSNIAPVIAAYVSDGFDFLAIRLQPGQGVQAMRPVSVTTPGAGVTLPLRMVAAGTGASVGITLWVVSGGRYEPANFPTFVITPDQLTWDFATATSDYATVRASREAAAQSKAWQIESSVDFIPYTIENVVLAGSAGVDYPPPTDVAASDGGTDAAGNDAAGTAATGTDAGPSFSEAARAQDLATCFPGKPDVVRITRMHTDLSQAALANDLVLRASSDQSKISNVYQLTKYKNAPVCPQCSDSLCATTSDAPRSGLDMMMIGLAGAAVLGTRRRKK
jgi:MYXO-CTERM domain-containing protein